MVSLPRVRDRPAPDRPRAGVQAASVRSAQPGAAGGVERPAGIAALPVPAARLHATARRLDARGEATRWPPSAALPGYRLLQSRGCRVARVPGALASGDGRGAAA